MQPFHPKNLPVELNYSIFARELAEASFELGKLDLQKKLPNPALIISPLTLKEATVSSKIEGTKSTVSDVAKFEAGADAKYLDTEEVYNYRKAMMWALNALKNRELNLSFIKDLHSILLEGKVRGHSKRGDFRKEQVFIGKDGDEIDQATYVPPEPYLINEYMENLEEYINNSPEDNILVKSGVMHYQFEAIHPFTDGNGRIGRLIIPLYLYKKKLLYQPILYLSGYFEKNRGDYIDSLHRVDLSQNHGQWLKLFLTAVKEQAKETQELIEKIESLMNNIEEKTSRLMSPYLHKFVTFIFARPIFTSKDLENELKINRMTASRLISRFVELNILTVIRERKLKRKKFYIFNILLRLL